MNGVEVATVTTAFLWMKLLEAKVLAKIAFCLINYNYQYGILLIFFIIRIGDKQYNASVANRLQVLKEN
jgi:F-type H+-transporting ATPase subunit delta